MAMYSLCFSSSLPTPFIQYKRSTFPPPNRRRPIFSASTLHSYFISEKCCTNDIVHAAEERSFSIRSSKRVLNISVLALILSATMANSSKAVAEELELERYTDFREGFTLLRPSSWIKVDKGGAAVLFEEPNQGANSIGVVVNPVRIRRLDEFGSPQFVADKLIQAERRKESTNDAEVIAVSDRSGHGGLPVYEFEYKVDSTRGGMKRVFAGAFVASKKLYLLNIVHSDRADNPIDTSRRMILEQVLHSFDVSE